ncbi:MAG: Crp/Fnr family transcriptional regulator [Burkholderiales bacterium]|nr:Crp/Fnr family transcriptional regulator [Burkholderiales bacterium]
MGIETGTALGLAGVAFTLASFAVRSMVPLRSLALAGNVLFIAYGIVESQLPSILLNCVLIPLNASRLLEIRKLTREIARATVGSPLAQWLLPHMRRRELRAGETLFSKGDAADRVIYLARGELALVEAGERVGAGELIGEIGLFSPEGRRTQTVRCAADAELYEMTAEMLFQLYFQNPKLGFHVMRLVAGRLLKDVQRAKPARAAA